MRKTAFILQIKCSCFILKNKYLHTDMNSNPYSYLIVVFICIYMYILCMYVYLCNYICMCIYTYMYIFNYVLLFSSNSKHCKRIGKDTEVSYQLVPVASSQFSLVAQWSLYGGNARMLNSLRTVLLNWCVDMSPVTITFRGSYTQKCQMDNFSMLGNCQLHGFALYSSCSRCMNLLYASVHVFLWW